MVSGRQTSLEKRERIRDLWKYSDFSRRDIHKKENVGIRQVGNMRLKPAQKNVLKE